MFSQFACCQLPNYTENANFQIRISQNAKTHYMHLCLSFVNTRYRHIDINYTNEQSLGRKGVGTPFPCRATHGRPSHGGNETEIFFIIAILVISWRMKRHIFWEKSYGKVSLAKFFLTVYKIFLNNGGNSSLSQRRWTPLQPLKKRFEKRYYEDVIDAKPRGPPIK